MADSQRDQDDLEHDTYLYRPKIAVGLLIVTALVSVAGVVVNLGTDSVSAIAATLAVASALTLLAFQSNRLRRKR